MGKVVFTFLFLAVLVMSISTVIGAEAPNENDKAAGSPTGAALEQISQAAAPTMSSMRGAAAALSSNAYQVIDTTKHETATWGQWFKDRLGAGNIFGSSKSNNGAPAPAPTA